MREDFYVFQAGVWSSSSNMTVLLVAYAQLVSFTTLSVLYLSGQEWPDYLWTHFPRLITTYFAHTPRFRRFIFISTICFSGRVGSSSSLLVVPQRPSWTSVSLSTVVKRLINADLITTRLCNWVSTEFHACLCNCLFQN